LVRLREVLRLYAVCIAGRHAFNCLKSSTASSTAALFAGVAEAIREHGLVCPSGVETQLLAALQRVATPWFRNENWEAHPFGALGTADMGSTFAQFLQHESRDLGHEALLVCILDAICYGEAFPNLVGIFEKIARDETRAQRVRFGEVAAWLYRSFSISHSFSAFFFRRYLACWGLSMRIVIFAY
jgi:hypothetical protein